jgi:hypothetical protein
MANTMQNRRKKVSSFFHHRALGPIQSDENPNRFRFYWRFDLAKSGQFIGFKDNYAF